MGERGLPDMMLACQVIEFHEPYKIHHVPTPTHLQPQDMLVRIGAASFCHTDMMVAEGSMGTTLPCTASHEGAGTVVAVGEAVTSFHVGDRVLCGIIYHRCGTCAICKGPEKAQHLCPKAQWLGVRSSGAFAEFEVVDSNECALLPDDLAFTDAAPFACAGATAWGALMNAGLQPGQCVALVGSGGGLGHFGIQFAKALGLRVIGIEARESGLKITRDYGADIIIDARDGQDAVLKAVHQATDGEGVDATINFSDAPNTSAISVAISRTTGRVVQIGLADIRIPFADFIFREIQLLGSMLCSAGQLRKMMEFVGKNPIRAKTNVFHGLHEVPRLLELAHSGRMLGKAVVKIEEA